ncbi:SMP-30/gluconolactonase/LRE family protein [Chelatococcus sp. GCM10030263]|uniref:SMP-30/gluconolactonase/LRE family protein n=1 Tax=Chelatococcus sp. GCM10030263 TaxID=3273387 RepID=UPI00360D4EFE
MYAAPPLVETQVFARVPDHLRRTDNPVIRGGHARDCFLEGPSFDRAGNLYCVDIPYGRIFRISPGGEFDVVCEYDGTPNGLKIHKDGRIFITCNKNGIMLLDPGSGRIEPYLESGLHERFRGTNDLIFSRDGDLYFTDQGQTGLQNPAGCLYRLCATGQLDRLLDNVPSPNGLVLDAAEQTLYLAVTRANNVWRVPLNLLDNGAVSRVGVFIQMSGGTGPDGMAMATDGSLAVAHVGMGTVWLFSKLGEPIACIRSCRGLLTTNVAFGGREGRTLYITESETGHILTAELPVAGLPLYSHQ